MYSKYSPLTEWLKKNNSEIIHLRFEELNNIVPLPNSAYVDRPCWANCTTENATSFQRSWQKAGYLVNSIDLSERWVEFRKNKIIPDYHSNNEDVININRKKLPENEKEEILLTVPCNLLSLETDRYFMVALSKKNYDIVKKQLDSDPIYRFKGREKMKEYFNDRNFSVYAYCDVIRDIAASNKTRTPEDVIRKLAEFCAASENNFLNRLKSGEPQLVDDMVSFLEEQKVRKDKSLASKVCRYLNEWIFESNAYTINDSIVRYVLPYYLAYYKIDRKFWTDKNFERLSYVEFFSIYSLLRDKVSVLNNHQLDHLIWYSYKDDSIRKEIANALSKIL